MTGFSLQKSTGRRSLATEVSDTFPATGTRQEKSFRRPEPRLFRIVCARHGLVVDYPEASAKRSTRS